MIDTNPMRSLAALVVEAPTGVGVGDLIQLLTRNRNPVELPTGEQVIPLPSLLQHLLLLTMMIGHDVLLTKLSNGFQIKILVY